MGLGRWLQARLRRSRRPPESVAYLKVLLFEAADEIPSPVPQGAIALAGTLEHPKWCAFTCPCGRDHQITLNMQRSYWPCWRLTLHKGLPTLHPSVHVSEPPFCHFTLSRGRVLWAKRRDETMTRPRMKGA